MLYNTRQCVIFYVCNVFNSVDNELLLNKIIGYGPYNVNRIIIHLVSQTMSMQMIVNQIFLANKGIPQGFGINFVFYFISFILLFINDFGRDNTAKLHLYADDTVIYTHAPSVRQTVQPQTATSPISVCICKL